ncbi:putative tyrosine-protein kinase [Fibrobacter succinogenes subsp. succinogenes S85]|uniref:Capsular exopolysaccharide family n=1 Tax=Fibrobacter succinogenes (strain ATCC 19169 / S85) TaxID=59374 RepID=C9RP30_FIBSS|nr:polysaccharide biosynthesis tyrosine autokinase [Fibrobacter succinogenes]ACX76498.1 capsular exopolysaccharide family [Fibrobacter succinogenes subsp. succinogenes S85]ADL25542.1 putative tyrosine-protein kinase [Fibrobacter succinogenes subsp. succinogenes S85]
MSEKEEQKVISQPTAIQVPQNANTITLLEALEILWDKKFILALFLIVGGAVGYCVANWLRPQYTSDVLLQIDVKGGKSGKAIGDMGALLDVASPADAEIELLKSRMILSYVVDVEHLCFQATPIGAADRFLHHEGRMDLDSLYIPQIARAEKWMARVTGDDTYEVISPEEQVILEGKVGEMHRAAYAGDTFDIQVSRMLAQPEQMFILSQISDLGAMGALKASLKVAEKGKQTGIIEASYNHRYPDRAAAILNTIAKTYLRQNVEMRSAEAAKTLEFLEKQLPGVKAKLDSVEKILADYRYSIGSVDMTGETHAHLNKESEIQRQILDLEQQKQAAMRLFKEEHPSVQTLIRQQNRLRAELAKLKKTAEKMPLTQQEVARLKEDVAVNNEIYTTMLNNIQQLRVVRAGEVGNVRIVDFAQINGAPSKPKKMNIIICSVAASFMLGVLLVFLLRMMHNGVRSVTEIERETNTSVLAKVPQNPDTGLNLKFRKTRKTHVQTDPDDPLSESIRSILTAIDFSFNMNKEHQVIMVSGIMPGVGKSFISTNLAATFAMVGKKTLFIDADMRKATCRFTKVGLVDVLMGKVAFDNAKITSPNLPNLDILESGKFTLSAFELLRGDMLKKLIDEIRPQYDAIIIDTPPTNLVTDAYMICPLIDFALVVLHYGRHSMDSIKESLHTLERYCDKPKAFVLNHCEHRHGYGYGYGYGYYGSKSKKHKN